MVIITGTIVDGQNARLGDLYELELEALKAWEQELRVLGTLR
jgi:hypothetical protein